jgi:hypothetical protein
MPLEIMGIPSIPIENSRTRALGAGIVGILGTAGIDTRNRSLAEAFCARREVRGRE